MVKYMSKRLLRSLVTVFIIVSTVFILMRQLPLDGFLPNVDKMSQEQIKNSLALLGLDKPIHGCGCGQRRYTMATTPTPAPRLSAACQGIFDQAVELWIIKLTPPGLLA